MNNNKKKIPIITLIGRVNVGKSTIFNIIAKKNISITNNIHNSTRDIIYQLINNNLMPYYIVDTSGINDICNNNIYEQTYQQTLTTIDKSHILIFVVDAKTGLMPLDIKIANNIRQYDNKIILLINKCDSEKLILKSYEFYSLLNIPIIQISALQKIGINKLLLHINKRITNLYNTNTFKTYKNNIIENNIKIALIGKTNVGKSSLINKILNNNRLITSQQPHSTTNAIYNTIIHNKQKYTLIDTAGIKNKSKIQNNLEKQSILLSLKSMNKCHIIMLLIDVQYGITKQDIKIASIAIQQNKGIIIIVNKWDLAINKNLSKTAYTKQLYKAIPSLYFTIIHFTSIFNNYGINKIFQYATIIFKFYNTRISTPIVNKWLKQITNRHSINHIKNKENKFLYGTQITTSPPVFLFFCNNPKNINISYHKHLLKKLHQHFTFTGIPLKIIYRNNKSKGKLSNT